MNRNKLKLTGAGSLRTMRFFFSFALISSLLAFTQSVATEDSILWATSGGGFRAMVSSMGFANVFARAGLISEDHCDFEAVSSNSGGAFFMLQFVYSSPFFNQILVDDPQQLGKFVLEWMGAFREFLPNTVTDARCSTLNTVATIVPPLSVMAKLCNLFGVFEYDWALFVQGFLNATSSKVYGDPDFIYRQVNSDNRIPAFQNTNVNTQMGLATTAKSDTGEIVTLGPNNSSQVFSVPLPTLFVVQSNLSAFHYAVDDTSLPFSTTTFAASSSYNSSDWEDYFLFSPPNNSNILTNITKLSKLSNESYFKVPFSGKDPTVVQLAASTSSYSSSFSPSVPAILSQQMSVINYLVQNFNLSSAQLQAVLILLQSGVESIYQTPIFEDFAVCSQWPQSCNNRDSRIIDGGYVDGPNLAQTIGMHQVNCILSKTLKIILTNHNFFEDTNNRFLQYFNTTFNQGIAPGDFIWPPPLGAGQGAESSPIRSKQIFSNFLDDASMLEAFVPIPGTNLTSAVYKVTTLENSAFKVKAGQNIEILLLQINSNIPTGIFGKNETDTQAPLLAELAMTIAESQILLERIAVFLGSSLSPSLAPSVVETGFTTPAPTHKASGVNPVMGHLSLYVALVTMMNICF